MDSTFNHPETPFITTHHSYPRSPSMSATSTPSLSTGSPSPSPSIEMNGFFNSNAAKYFCPMTGCMYSAAVGFSSTEELFQHMALMCHFPETQPLLKSQVVSMTDLDNSSTVENTEGWLEVPQCMALGALSNSAPNTEDWLTVKQCMTPRALSNPTSQNHTPPSMHAFTFTYDHKAQSPPATASRCDCHHCQFQGNWASPTISSPIKRSNSSRRTSSVYDIPTPLTIQMPPPPTIINLPAPPPSPSSKLQESHPPPPNSNQYALWQQQIQIAQVTEMLRAQKRQREAQRRTLEGASPSREHATVPRISQEYPQAYSFLRPTYYPASR